MYLKKYTFGSLRQACKWKVFEIPTDCIQCNQGVYLPFLASFISYWERGASENAPHLTRLVAILFASPHVESAPASSASLSLWGLLVSSCLEGSNPVVRRKLFLLVSRACGSSSLKGRKWKIMTLKKRGFGWFLKILALEFFMKPVEYFRKWSRDHNLRNGAFKGKTSPKIDFWTIFRNLDFGAFPASVKIKGIQKGTKESAEFCYSTFSCVYRIRLV